MGNTHTHTHTHTHSQTHIWLGKHRLTHISAWPPALGIPLPGSLPSTLHPHPALAQWAFLSEATSSPAHSPTSSPEVTAAPTPPAVSSPGMPLLPALHPDPEALGPATLTAWDPHAPAWIWLGSWPWRLSAAKQLGYHGDSGRKTPGQPQGVCGRGKGPAAGPEPTGRGGLCCPCPASPFPPGAPGRARVGRGRSVGRPWLCRNLCPPS